MNDHKWLMQRNKRHIVYYNKDFKEKIHSRMVMLLGVQMRFNKIRLKHFLGFDFKVL
jgi:hypothetical protein